MDVDVHYFMSRSDSVEHLCIHFLLDLNYYSKLASKWLDVETASITYNAH